MKLLHSIVKTRTTAGYHNNMAAKIGGLRILTAATVAAATGSVDRKSRAVSQRDSWPDKGSDSSSVLAVNLPRTAFLLTIGLILHR